MYDELIKDLREWPRICVEYTGSIDELHDKAADAIEELQKRVPKRPHGRLIDADALVDSFDPSDFWNPDAEDNCFAAIHVVNCAPTVIEAEEGE